MSALPLQDGDEVLIRDFDNNLIQATKDGRIKKVDSENKKCIYKLIKKGKGKWAILNFNKKYLSISPDGDPIFTAGIPLLTEKFNFHGLSPQEIQIEYENPTATNSDFYWLSLTADYKFILTKNKSEPSISFRLEVL